MKRNEFIHGSGCHGNAIAIVTLAQKAYTFCSTNTSFVFELNEKKKTNKIKTLTSNGKNMIIILYHPVSMHDVLARTARYTDLRHHNAVGVWFFGHIIRARSMAKYGNHTCQMSTNDVIHHIISIRTSSKARWRSCAPHVFDRIIRSIPHSALYTLLSSDVRWMKYGLPRQRQGSVDMKLSSANKHRHPQRIHA